MTPFAAALFGGPLEHKGSTHLLVDRWLYLEVDSHDCDRVKATKLIFQFRQYMDRIVKAWFAQLATDPASRDAKIARLRHHLALTVAEVLDDDRVLDFQVREAYERRDEPIGDLIDFD